MYVGGVLLLRNFPFVGEVRLTVLTRFGERAIRYVLTGQSTGWALVNATSRRSLRFVTSGISRHWEDANREQLYWIPMCLNANFTSDQNFRYRTN